jgi:hypothetical protein
LITRDDGTDGDGDVAAAERRLRHVLLQEEREVTEAYGLPGTPTAGSLQSTPQTLKGRRFSRELGHPGFGQSGACCGRPKTYFPF